MSSSGQFELEAAIGSAMAPDRYQLRSRLRALSADAQRGTDIRARLGRLAEQIERSVARRAARQAGLPPIRYDESLPIHACRDDIAAALCDHQVIIVCGETGSGKSTQLPKICLDLGRGVDGMIGHTQPRRLAARSIAARLAEELHSPLGKDVGYKIRFTDRTRGETYVKLMTDGILLAETPGDRFLNQYDTIILDEAHERSLNIDFLLGYLKRLLPKRPELRCIITSATIDARRFSAHFATRHGAAPVIEVSGRSYPVDVHYRPAEFAEDEPEQEVGQQIVAAVGELLRLLEGDILVFLPTERDIREAATALNRQAQRWNRPLELLPLYARLPATEQNRVFAAHRHRRVVLATNVAESSLTVPGIRAVVDTGTARISRYSPRSKVQRLPIEAVSQASADQRKGRCGRVGPGICIRLYSEEDYLAREKYTTPEIRRTNLAAVILRTIALKLGPIDAFPFLDPPRLEAIRDGYKTLFELGAIDDQRALTPLGRALSRLPVDPPIGRMILAANDHNCLHEVLIIAAGLEVHDPRDRPADKTQAADQCHAQLAHEESDFLGILKTWDFFHHLKETLSSSQLRRACRKNFLSYNRLREWADIYRQLRRMVEDNGHVLRARRDDYDAIHKSLLTGLLSGVALRTETYEYTGAGGTKLHVWPGSCLFKQRPAWIVAAELVETTRRYCRVVARIDPDWIEPIAAHLVKRSYNDPYWDRHSAAAKVFERVSLFGLPVVTRRRVSLGPVDPQTARQLFIQHALVERQLRGRFEFLDHNRRVLDEIQQLAARQRRSDWIVGQQAVFEFYDRRIPEHVFDARRLKQWLKKIHESGQSALHMRQENLLDDVAAELPEELFPNHLAIQKARFPLSYRFLPGDEQDGVTMTIPRHAVNQISRAEIDWLVPGRLEEKITALIRSLPKSIRRCLVPAPDTARQAASQLAYGDGPFLPRLARVLEQIGGEPIPVDAFQLDRLPPHLVMKVRLVDDTGKTLAIDADLDRLRSEFGAQAPGASGHIDDARWNGQPTRDWDFGELPVEVVITRGGLRVSAFPAVIDQEDGVVVRLVNTLDRAGQESRAGVRRLYYLAQRKSLQAHVAWLPRLAEVRLLATTMSGCGQLDLHLALLIADRAFLHDADLPRDEDAYRERLAEAAERAGSAVQEIAPLIYPLFKAHHEARLEVEKLPSGRWNDAATDARLQLDALTSDGFLMTTPWTWLHHYPRYFRAVAYRLDKLAHGGQARDQQAMRQLQPWVDACEQRAESHRRRGVIDPELALLRWMIEEFRVSLFAQQLGTSMSVSTKRLEKQWAKVIA